MDDSVELFSPHVPCFHGLSALGDTFFAVAWVKGMPQTISFLAQLMQFVIHPGHLVWAIDWLW